MQIKLPFDCSHGLSQLRDIASVEMKKNFWRNSLIVLLALLGIGALYGGGLLVISPSGEMLGMPISHLDASPFRSFLIPGLILFTILGIWPILLVFALIYPVENKFMQRLNAFYDMHWSWSFTIYVACALIIWIQLQMVFLNAVHWSYTLYMFWAMAILLIALLPKVRGFYQR